VHKLADWHAQRPCGAYLNGYLRGLAMAAYESESVVQLASASKKAAAPGVDQLDSAGQMILQLLNKAANVAEQNSKHAIDMAQKLAHELRAAQQRISELEAEVVAYQNQAERAEQWLHKVYTEIEDRFLRQERSGALRRSR
jgi:threonine aldolase